MQIGDALDQLGRQIGLKLKLDRNNACRLVFDKSTTVDIEAVDAGTVFLHAAVGIVPTAGRDAVYETLLEANLFGRGTGAAVLAVDKSLGEVVLHRRLDMAKTEYSDFTAALEDFVTHARAWTDRLEAMRRSTAAPAASGIPTETFMRI